MSDGIAQLGRPRRGSRVYGPYSEAENSAWGYSITHGVRSDQEHKTRAAEPRCSGQCFVADEHAWFSSQPRRRHHDSPFTQVPVLGSWMGIGQYGNCQAGNPSPSHSRTGGELVPNNPRPVDLGWLIKLEIGAEREGTGGGPGTTRLHAHLSMDIADLPGYEAGETSHGQREPKKKICSIIRLIRPGR